MKKYTENLEKEYNEKLSVVNRQLDWLDTHLKHPEVEKYIDAAKDNINKLSALISTIEGIQGFEMTTEQILTGFVEM